MTYELRQGVVLTKICGEYLLIPDRQASEKCPSAKRLSIIGAALIENIQKKDPIEKICRVYEILGKKSPEEAKAKIYKMLSDLIKEGFIVPSDDNS